MNRRHHALDAQLAALDHAQVETLWRQAIASHDADSAEPLARQLVLRALPILEGACRLRGSRARMSDADIAVAVREASVKLMLRLLHHADWRSLGGLAAEIASEVIDDPRRRRRPQVNPFAGARSPLRLVHDASPPPISQTKENDHGRS
jgi:hypothetical protein